MVLRLLFAGIAVSAVVLAQGGGGRGEQNGTPPGGAMGMQVQKESKGDQIVSRLKLSKEQKSEFVTILETAAKDADPMVKQLQQSRNMLATALIMSKPQAELDPIIKAIGKVERVNPSFFTQLSI